VIGTLDFGIGQSAPQRVGLEQNVGVGKQQPVADRLLCRRPHGMSFSQPACGQFTMMDDTQSPSGGARCDFIHNLPGRTLGAEINFHTLATDAHCS